MRRWKVALLRRMHLALSVLLLLSLVPFPALQPAILAATLDDLPEPPPATPLTVDLPADPHLPGLVVHVAVAPDPLAVGQAATLTVEVLNEGTDPAEALVVTVPAATGATALPGDGYDAKTGGWRWAVGHLDPGGLARVSGTFTLASTPPGDAVLFAAEATAAGLPQPARAEGGALVEPVVVGAASLPVVQAAALATPTAEPAASAAPTSAPAPTSATPARVAPTAPAATSAAPSAAPGASAAPPTTPAASAVPAASALPSPSPSPAPAPSQDPGATAPFTPGQPATLASRDGRVRVAVPADAADRPLTLSAGRTPSHGERVPPAQAGQKVGLGTFYLGAADGARQTVHQFKAPVTITATYTPEQLRARGIAEADLALFYFDEAADGGGRWVAIPTTIDTDRREATASVDHFTPFQLSDGSQPSKNYLPNLADWQVNLFTGAATYSMPLDLPAGPAGQKPDLTLSYNSQQTDGKAGQRALGRAGWAGLGWTLEMPAIGLQKTYVDNVVYYSLSVGGVNTQLARGNPLVGSPNLAVPSDWEWNTTDESYIRVRAVAAGTTDGTVPAGMTSARSISTHQGARPRYYWKVRMGDNSTYEFAEDLWQGYNNCASTQSVDFEPYKWYLTRATDRFGNTIDYAYSRLDASYGNVACGGGSSASGQGTTQIDARPASITWAGGRYRVEFRQTARSDDNQSDAPSNQFPDWTATPRVTGVLDGIWLYSKQAGSWEGVRGWALAHDYGLKSDHTINGNQADVYNRLRLTGIQRIGKHTVPTLPTAFGSPTLPALPQTTFTYGTARGSNPDPVLSGVNWPNADWNRLTGVNNGQGGTVGYAYEQIGRVVSKTIFGNHRRVTTKTTTDGQGNSYPWTYQYATPMLNSLGTTVQPGDPNATTTYPNSAALYLAWAWGSNWSAQRTHLLSPDNEEFRGHGWVKETRPDGAYSEHWFYQGDAGCTPTATGTNTASYDADSCFVSIRTREFLRGKEYQSEQKSSGGTVLSRVESAFGVSFLNYCSPEIGVWRAWTFPTAKYESAVEGGTPVVKTTNYAYDNNNQFDNYGNSGNTVGQYGNLTRTAEYAGDTRPPGANPPRVRLTVRTFNTLVDGSSNWLISLPREEIVYGATDSEVLARTDYFYDTYAGPGSVAFGVQSAGQLKLVRKFGNASAATQGVDTATEYDAYGNPTQSTTYAGYAATQFAAPGGGTAARTTTTAYDSTFHAFPISVTPPDPNGVNLTETATYDYRMGTLLSTTDPNGAVTSAGDPANQATYPGYDAFGRLLMLIKPGDTSTAPSSVVAYYDGQVPVRYLVGQRENSSAGNLRWTTTFYDGLGRQIQQQRETSNGSTTQVADTRYDGLGRVTQRSQPYDRAVADVTVPSYVAPPGGTAWTTTTYDGLGRPRLLTAPDGATTEHIYGVYGDTRLDDVVDANRHRTQSRTDALGRLVQVWEIAGDCGGWGYACAGPYTTGWTTYAGTTYAYDGRDLLKTATDAAGNVTTVEYDGLGRKTGMHDPDMGTWAYTYNPDGTLYQQTDAKSQTTTFTYDTLGRLKAKAAPGLSATWNYDEPGLSNGKGRLTSWANAAATGWRHYDPRGRVVNDSLYATALAATRAFIYTYDSADRVATVTYPTGEVVTNGYDAGWRQTSACSSLGGCYASGVSYTALDAEAGTPLGNGRTEGRGYDATGRLTSLSVDGAVFGRGYTYDGAGNVATATDTLVGEVTHYTYDHRDRLTRAWTTGSPGWLAAFDESYTYNLIGNLTGKGPTGSLATYGYNASGASSVRPHAATSVGGAVYAYDGNGNLTSRTGKALTWNADNTVATAVGPDNVPEGYAYDANGQRVTRSRNIGQTGGFTTVYIGGLYEEDTPSGTVRVLYQLNGRAVAQRSIVGGTPTVVYLHADQLGSVGGASTAAGASQGLQYYTPFGAIRLSSGMPATALAFTGQRQDGTGLLFYNARYYDPTIGRFVSADSVVPGAASGQGGAAASLGASGTAALRPLTVDFHEPGFSAGLAQENRFTLDKGFTFQLSDKDRRQAKDESGPLNAQALNRYSYVLNNPVRYTDPSGHVICVCILWNGIVGVLDSLGGDLWEGLQGAATWAAMQFVGWLFENGLASVVFHGADGVDRTLSSSVKQNRALDRQARRMSQKSREEANHLYEQFINGNTNPGIGNKTLTGTDVFYLRGIDGARVFLRKVGENAYDIVGYADKAIDNEDAVIAILYKLYGR